MKVVLKDLTKIFPSRNKNGQEVVAVNNFDFEIPDGNLSDCSDLPAAEKVRRCI